MKLRQYEPQLGPALSPEQLAQLVAAHLAQLDAEQDAIAERIRGGMSRVTRRVQSVTPDVQSLRIL